MLKALNETGAGLSNLQMMNSTVIRAHQHAAGALKRGCGPRFWPLVRLLRDQDPSPQQRSRYSCRGFVERRTGLRCERLCPGHGLAWPASQGAARRRGLRRNQLLEERRRLSTTERTTEAGRPKDDGLDSGA